MKIVSRRVLKVLLIGAAGLALAIQVVRPARTNPPVDPARTLQATARLTPEVAAIFDRACLDCHSYQTRWPWYTEVAPVSWFIANHVAQGRRHLNLSQWQEKPKIQDHKLGEICEQVKHGEMPLSSYTLIHRYAKLAPGEAEVLCAWTKSERERLAPLLATVVPAEKPPTGGTPPPVKSDDR
jgi:Haem-binding domain